MKNKFSEIKEILWEFVIMEVGGLRIIMWEVDIVHLFWFEWKFGRALKNDDDDDDDDWELDRIKVDIAIPLIIIYFISALTSTFLSRTLFLFT